MTIRTIVAERHRLVREAITTALSANPSIEVVASVGDGYEAVARIRELAPDVVLLPAELPGLSASDVCLAVRDSNPDTNLVVMGDGVEADVVLAAIQSGATGFVDSDQRSDALFDVVERTVLGEVVVPQLLFGPLLQRLIAQQRATDSALRRYLKLTPREREVLALLVDGQDHDDIADALVISTGTARTHIQNVLSKLEVHSRLEAVAVAVEHGWVQPGMPKVTS